MDIKNRFGKKARKKFRRYTVYALIALAGVLLMAFFSSSIIKATIIVLLIFLGSICKIYKQFIKISIGFELITPIVIIFAYDINVLLAIFSGAFMIVVGELISGSMKGNVMLGLLLINTLNAILATLASAFIPYLSFIYLAVFLILLRNILMFIMMSFFGVDPFRAMLATIPNFFINTFLLSTVGVYLVNLF